MRPAYLIAALLAALTAVVFWPLRQYGFVNFDDPAYITENPYVRGGVNIESVLWAFTTGYQANWHPLTWLSLMLDAQLYGVENPGGFHVSNVVLHIAGSLLLYAALTQMTGAPWRSALVATLFAVHPLHVEPVAWVTARKDVLSIFFGMLALWSYAKYAVSEDAARLRWYWLSLGAFACSLMAKQALVTLPFVLLLLDYWPLGRLTKPAATGPSAGAKPAPSGPGGAALELLIEKLPFFALTVAFCVIAVLAQSGGGLSDWETFSLRARVSNAVVVYVKYLGMTIVPHGLAVFYPHPGESIPLARVLGAALLLVAITSLVITQARRRPCLLVGWLWYLGTLVPMIGLLQTGRHEMADRFTYFPIIGLFLAVIWAVPLPAAYPAWRRRLVFGATILLLLALALAARRQVSYWQNSVTLFQHAVEVTRNNTKAHNNLGHTALRSGRLDDAMYHYRRTLAISAEDTEAHANLAVALRNSGQLEAALHHFQEVVRIAPRDAVAHRNLGNLLGELGRLEEAVAHFRQAVRIDPQFARGHASLGSALRQRGQFQEALPHFEEACRLAPAVPELQFLLAATHLDLGAWLGSEGRLSEASSHFRQAMGLAPEFPPARLSLALVLIDLGQLAEAEQQLQALLRGWPGFAEAHNAMGRLRLRQAKKEQALRHFQEAIRLRPDYPEARENLRRALAEGRAEDTQN